MKIIVGLIFVAIPVSASAKTAFLSCKSNAGTVVPVAVDDTAGTVTYSFVTASGDMRDVVSIGVFTADKITFGYYSIDRTNLAWLFMDKKDGQCRISSATKRKI